MKLLQELTNRKTLQGALKAALKSAGTFDDVFGRNAEEVADAVHDKSSSKVYVVDVSTPQAKAAAGGVMASPEMMDVHGVKVIRLGGSNRALVANGKVYFGEYQAGRLIESQDEAD